jgi:hypothetical protein
MHDIDPRAVVAELLSTVPVDASRDGTANRRAGQYTQTKPGTPSSPAR